MDELLRRRSVCYRPSVRCRLSVPGTLLGAGWKSDAGNGSGVVWTSSDGVAWEHLPDQVSMSGASLAGATLASSLPVVVGTSGYPDNDQASAWFEEP